MYSMSIASIYITISYLNIIIYSKLYEEYINYEIDKIYIYHCICADPPNCLNIQCGPTPHGRYGAYECQKDCQGRGFHNGACFRISPHNTQCCCNK